MRTSILSLSFVAFVTASCSNGSDPQPTAPRAFIDADIAISADNAMTAAQVGVRAAFDFLQLSYICASFVQTPQPEPPTGGGGAGGGGAAPTVLSSVVPGPAGGSARFAWEDVDGSDSYSSNDVFTIDFVGYGDAGMTLDGVVVIDDFRLAGILPGDGTYICDATLKFIGLEVTLGTQTNTFNLDLPFRTENRIIIEIFEPYLFEPQFFGDIEVQQDPQLIRYESDEVVRYYMEGAVFSPELEGTLRFKTPSYLRASPFLADPTEGTLEVRGAGNTMLEIEPSCIVPGVCFSLDVRVDSDGDEQFDQTLVTSWGALLPQ